MFIQPITFLNTFCYGVETRIKGKRVNYITPYRLNTKETRIKYILEAIEFKFKQEALNA
jgi:hypothetical protein